MAYQDLALRNVAGEIAVTYNDNNMSSTVENEPSFGPRVFATATAKTGVAGKVYQVENLARTMADFDSRSELANLISRVRGANNTMPLSVARVGSKKSHFLLQRDVAVDSYEKETLVSITPVLSQEEDLDRNLRKTLKNYKLILLPFVEGNMVRQRVIIVASNFKETQHVVAYDSERIFQIDGDAVFDVEINLPLGECLVTPDATSLTLADDFTLLQLQEHSDLRGFKFANLPRLSDADVLSKIQHLDLLTETVEVLSVNVGSGYLIKQIDGSAGDYISHVERYAVNEMVYEELEFENFQYLYCEGCYADINPVSLSAGTKLKDQARWHQNSLGHMWKFVNNGRPYIYMFMRKNPFDAGNVAASYVHSGITISMNAEQQKLGDLLNLVEFHIHSFDGANGAVESIVNEYGLIECHMNVDLDNAASIQTPFGTLAIPVGNIAPDNMLKFRHRPSLVDGTRSLSEYLLLGTQSYDLDPFVMTHFELTGDLVPEAVVDRLVDFTGELDGATLSDASLEAVNAEVREVSFLHQAGQAAYTASTNYNQVIALVPTTKPPASLNGVSAWAGNPGTYVVNNLGELEITKNGTGVLGTRLLAGATDYRGGAAFGGVILTNGDSLPNQIPYGIDDQDEAVDGNNNPIDLGKHCVVVGAWGATSSAEAAFPKNGSKPRVRTTGSITGNAGPQIAAILNQLAPGTEPIGPILGRVPGFSPQQRTPRKVLNDLAALRICMIDQTGVISSIYTSALRTSDYRKISSIIAANTIVSRVRAICEPIIGQAYDDAQVASLQQAIEGSSRAMVQDRIAQAVNVRLYASRLDRINGVLRCSVNFVPPLSIEAITIDLTLEAPQG
jgi:hypothetical protein